MEMKRQNLKKIRLHDAIVGLMYLSSAVLAFFVNIHWLYLAVGVGMLQLLSPLTRFCPVYAILNRLIPDSEPIQNGR